MTAPFGCGLGSQFHHGSRFTKPPYDPGRSDFPSPVLTSALHATFQMSTCPADPGAQALARIHPKVPRFIHTLVPSATVPAGTLVPLSDTTASP